VAIARQSPFIQHHHKVSGLMIANHTSIRQLFTKIQKDFQNMRKMNAYIESYKQEPLFSDGLGEFDDSIEVVTQLIEEYKNAEQPNFIDWNLENLKPEDNNSEDMGN
jgi:tubulin gamma